jgi:hypothetical protein
MPFAYRLLIIYLSWKSNEELYLFDFVKNFPQKCIVQHHITVVVQLILDYNKVAKHDLSSQSS